jgi:hypothetical protein
MFFAAIRLKTTPWCGYTCGLPVMQVTLTTTRSETWVIHALEGRRNRR